MRSVSNRDCCEDRTVERRGSAGCCCRDCRSTRAACRSVLDGLQRSRRRLVTDGGCCEARHDLSENALLDDVRAFSALSNETRYETLRYVAGAGEVGACVCELPPLVGVTQGTVSNALSRLREAGLVSRRKEGRWRYYTATPAAKRLLSTVDELREADNE